MVKSSKDPVTENPYISPQSNIQQPLEGSSVPTGFRIFAGLLAISGAPFLLSVVFLVTIPGLFVWIGWILIAFNLRKLNCFSFWFFSLLVNQYTFFLLIWLRNGDFGLEDPSMFWVWGHLLIATIGSGYIFAIQVLPKALSYHAKKNDP